LALESTAQVLDKINRGEGTIGELVNNDTLYNNLEQSALELDKLLEDLRVNPKRYVHFSIFGKRDKDKPELKPRE
jgi:phospholipid/cholesterol/gamma-HCH transport system substrate-binding protein